jgi:hypothetical protein
MGLIKIFVISLSTLMMIANFAYSGTVGDINNDGKVDLTEAIYALQVASGGYPSIKPSCQLVGKGSWSAGTDYQECDVVTTSDKSYACTNSHTSSVDFSIDSANWQLLSIQPISMKLQCYTGELFYTPDITEGYCNDPHSLNIVTPYPSSTNPDDIFEIYCEEPSPYSSDAVFWGLRCKEGWTNTGCSGTAFGTYNGNDVSIVAAFNGCYTDDDEFGNANVFTTCCKIVPVQP